MISNRARALNTPAATNTPLPDGKVVVYVMSRDQRVQDNLALLEAQKYAIEHKLPLLVFFNLVTAVAGRAHQHFTFMIEGLKEVEHTLHELHIPLYVTVGPALDNIQKICSLYKAAAVFCDFSPLKEAVETRTELCNKLDIPVYEVDTHNVVPLWLVSEKEEYSARTIRPKIHAHLKEFLVEPEQVQRHPFPFERTFQTDWEGSLQRVKAEELQGYSPSFIPGGKAAQAALQDFVSNRLQLYADYRNDPVKDYTSGLSPYFHYGQLAPLRAALEVQKAAEGQTEQLEIPAESSMEGQLSITDTPEHQLPTTDISVAQRVSKAHNSTRQSAIAFLEELIVRNTLAQNFCYYAKSYTKLAGVREWARDTLDKHKHDKRPVIYTLEQLEEAQTYDLAWNAAQLQMMKTGKMHGYMRMYWAKKVLEWTPDAQTAIDYCVYLNDKYHLDGYEANGYVGILWAIAGVHDRPWFERPIFGTIRYMNFNGLKRKFDVDLYIARWTGLTNQK